VGLGVTVGEPTPVGVFVGFKVGVGDAPPDEVEVGRSGAASTNGKADEWFPSCPATALSGGRSNLQPRTGPGLPGTPDTNWISPSNMSAKNVTRR
jgi:hypothetical protein